MLHLKTKRKCCVNYKIIFNITRKKWLCFTFSILGIINISSSKSILQEEEQLFTLSTNFIVNMKFSEITREEYFKFYPRWILDSKKQETLWKPSEYEIGRIREMKKEYWQKFSTSMEQDMFVVTTISKNRLETHEKT